MNQENLRGKSAYPLLSWDIYIEGMHRRMQLADDIESLQEIIRKNSWKKPAVAPEHAMVWQNKVVLITNQQLQIVYASRNIFKMNGYKATEVIGNSPRMFQGEETENAEKLKIRDAVKYKQPFESVITNYKKDGSTYKCHIEGFPVFNRAGGLVNFVALEKDLYR